MATFDQSGQTVGNQVNVGKNWERWEPNRARYGVYEMTPKRLAWLQRGGQLLLTLPDGQEYVVEWQEAGEA